MARPKLEECPDRYVEAIARIVGEQSAAAKAVAERDERRRAGEDVAVFLDMAGWWVVGPKPLPLTAPNERK